MPQLVIADGAPGHLSQAELDFRSAALRVGSWVGWVAILAVFVGLSPHVGSKHGWLLLALTVAAAAGNVMAMRLPWRRWLSSRRGRWLLDLWSGAIIGFIALLVIVGGANFTLLLFLAIPFIAVVQAGWRRGFWLAVSGLTCTAAAALIPLPADATAMRLSLVAAVVAVALVLAQAIQRESAARRRAAERAELERVLASEAHHRIKNSLQSVADFLLLARPEGDQSRAFDDSALRIRSIASVHRLLMENGGHALPASSLLKGIADGAPVEISVEGDPVVLEPATAQKLGIVANELIANAVRHGAQPIDVRLTSGAELRLRVDDGGRFGSVDGSGLGLTLVRRMVEQGLGGSFDVGQRRGGGTRAEVVFPAAASR